MGVGPVAEAGLEQLAADPAVPVPLLDGEQRQPPDPFAHEPERDPDDLPVGGGDPGPAGVGAEQVGDPSHAARDHHGIGLRGVPAEESAPRDGLGGLDVGGAHGADLGAGGHGGQSSTRRGSPGDRYARRATGSTTAPTS